MIHIAYIIYITHMVNLISKVNKETDKIIFFLYITVLTRYYQKSKERLSKKARARYQNLSDKEKEMKRHYGCKRCKKLLEDEKQGLVEFTKI